MVHQSRDRWQILCNRRVKSLLNLLHWLQAQLSSFSVDQTKKEHQFYVVARVLKIKTITASSPVIGGLLLPFSFKCNASAFTFSNVFAYLLPVGWLWFRLRVRLSRSTDRLQRRGYSWRFWEAPRVFLCLIHTVFGFEARYCFIVESRKLIIAGRSRHTRIEWKCNRFLWNWNTFLNGHEWN